MEWRTCLRWPDYEVSENGSIRRVIAAPRRRYIGERIPYQTSGGYWYIVMHKGKTKMACAIHRLVAESFIGESPFEGAQVAHSDGNKSNNCYKNLRWVSRKENEADKVKHGRSNRGCHKSGRAILCEEDIRAIRKKYNNGTTPSVLAAQYGVSRQTINSAVAFRSWKWVS